MLKTWVEPTQPGLSPGIAGVLCEDRGRTRAGFQLRVLAKLKTALQGRSQRMWGRRRGRAEGGMAVAILHHPPRAASGLGGGGSEEPLAAAWLLSPPLPPDTFQACLRVPLVSGSPAVCFGSKSAKWIHPSFLLTGGPGCCWFSGIHLHLIFLYKCLLNTHCAWALGRPTLLFLDMLMITVGRSS